MGKWQFLGQDLDESLLDGKKSFVYLITNLTNDKKYIGKKKLTFFRNKRVKGRSRRTKVTKESDWRTYFGSSKELLEDVKILGEDKFERQILRFCDSTAEASYWELWYQMTNHVLLSDEYYNSYVGAKIHRIHMKNQTSPLEKC